MEREISTAGLLFNQTVRASLSFTKSLRHKLWLHVLKLSFSFFRSSFWVEIDVLKCDLIKSSDPHAPMTDCLLNKYMYYSSESGLHQ